MKGEVELITIDEFIREVWEVEHIKIALKPNIGVKKDIEKRIRLAHYPYKDPFDENKTVDEFLNERIRPCIPIVLLMASFDDGNGSTFSIF